MTAVERIAATVVSRLRQVPLHQVVSRGYSFQQEVLYRCRKAGCRIGETPIIFADRRAGSSKVNMREAVRSISLLLYLGLQGVFRPGCLDPWRQVPNLPGRPCRFGTCRHEDQPEQSHRPAGEFERFSDFSLSLADRQRIQ